MEIVNGTRKIIAYKSNGFWYARLYVNSGQTATFVSGRFNTEAGLRKWAEKKLKQGNATKKGVDQ